MVKKKHENVLNVDIIMHIYVIFSNWNGMF